jgi:hypothetical protein
MIGRIYRIDCSCGCNGFYIGSTKQSLKKRLGVHFSIKRSSKISKHIEGVGRDKFKIILLEEIEFENKVELLKKEKEYFNLLKPTFNENSPLATEKENKERIKKWHKEWAKKNPEIKKEKYLNWVENNYEYNIERHKRYREDNIEKVKESQRKYRLKKKESNLLTLSRLEVDNVLI